MVERTLTSSAVVALLTADWHLQDRVWKDRPRLTGDAQESLRQIVSLALEQGCPVICAGDVVNRPRNDSGMVRWFREELERLHSNSNCRLLFVQGNHDLQEGQPPWPKVLDARSVYLPEEGYELANGWRVRGLDYQCEPERALRALSTLSASAEVVVLHQQLRELLPYGADFSAQELPVGPRIYCCGDVHLATSGWVTLASGGTTCFVSPGSICLQSIDEDEQKSVYLLRADGFLERRALLTRPVLRVRISAELQLAAECAVVERWLSEQARISENLPEALRWPIVVLKYDSQRAARAPEEFQSLCRDRAELFLRPVSFALPEAEEGSISLELPDLLRADPEGGAASSSESWNFSLRGLIDALYGEAEPRWLRQHLLRLLEAADPQRELLALEQEFLQEFSA